MNRKKFFRLFAKSAAVVAVAPTVVPSMLTLASDNKKYCFNSYKVGDYTFHFRNHDFFYHKGIDDAKAIHKFRGKIAEALFVDGYKYD